MLAPAKQVRRFFTPSEVEGFAPSGLEGRQDGEFMADMIFDELTGPPDGEATIVDVKDATRRKVIPAGTAFEDLPEDWVCPVCGADKSMFEES